MALTDNILAYWNLNNNGSGGVRLVDSTGNSNTLTNNNGVTLGNGIVAGGGSFDGTNQLDINAIPIGGSSFSISFWYKKTAIGVGGFVGPFSASSSDTSWGIFVIDQSDDAFRVFCPGVSAELALGSGPNIGEWTHICIVYDVIAELITAYVNGSSIVTETASINLNNGCSIYLGYELAGNSYLIGNIDEAGIWDRALTGGEVSALYNGGDGLTYPFNILYFSGGNLSSLSNWWEDAGFTIQAASLPNSNTTVNITENATSGSLICAAATINNASNSGSITGDCTFTGTSSNSGSITGNASVYYPAQNSLGGSVSGTISYFWPNGTGIWGGDVWIDGENVLIIPAENEVKAGVVYGFPNDPLTGTYTGEGGGGGDATIARLLNLPWFVKI
jgi:hypothetical protein